MYALKIDKFMMRHFIKPGITGLAQTKGLRGEIETERDMVNRIKLDVFILKLDIDSGSKK
jgi:putative colanic acid biosynthesis UDP-glucose lipid carrier transferase